MRPGLNQKSKEYSMFRTSASSKPSSVSQALAKDRLGVRAVLFFVLADVAPLTAAAVIVFFARGPRGESPWQRLAAPAAAAVLLAGIVVLAVAHYSTLLGVPAGDPAAWLLPASYALAGAAGLGWGLVLKARRPGVYATVGLGAHAVTGQLTPGPSA
jgi:hypothetical protein